MEVNLVLFKKDGGTKIFTLPGAVTVIGRRQDCDLCIPLMVISRKHCEINIDQDHLKIRDLGSRNGTFVNGRRIEQAVLRAGDRIDTGPLFFRVQIDGLPAEFEIPDSEILAPPEHIAQIEDADKSGETIEKKTIEPSGNHNATEIFNGLNED